MDWQTNETARAWSSEEETEINPRFNYETWSCYIVSSNSKWQNNRRKTQTISWNRPKNGFVELFTSDVIDWLESEETLRRTFCRATHLHTNYT